jgi:hypothetical protein
MSDYQTFWIIGFFLLVGGLSAFVISRRRHQRDLKEYLEPVLRECGVTFISAVYPGAFNVGPFPKVEVETGRPQTKVGGVCGEYAECRVVSFSNSHGVEFHLWALVEFEMFRFRRVRWRAERKELLPQSVLPILEN